MEYPLPLNITLKKFQLECFNKLKDNHAAIYNFSTGAGKSVAGIALANYLLKEGRIDKVVVASRNHNKTNWEKQFEFVASLEAKVGDAPGPDAETKRYRRKQIYDNSQIIIVNYEKFRPAESGGDLELLTKACSKRRVLFIFDEMPMYLKNKKALAYRGTQALIRACRESYKIMLSATPIENSPEDIYWTMRVLDPTIFPRTVAEFRDRYGKTRNPFAPEQILVWNQDLLPEIGEKLSPIIFKADKINDPEIRKQFPTETWENVIIDLSVSDRRLYKEIINIVRNDWETDSMSKFLALQLICDNPLLLKNSGAKLSQYLTQKLTLTDKNCAKLQTLKELIEQIDGKIVIFNMYNDLGAKMIYRYARKWGFPSVLYDGTPKEKQLAEDLFKSNPDIKLFISSDQGSDSINLEQASSCINVNFPWKWTTLIQRVNRINRLTSTHPHVFYYNLITANTIEERKVKVLEKKKRMLDGVFEGVEDYSGLSKEDYKYIMFGES